MHQEISELMKLHFTWQSRHCRHCRLSSVHWRWNCFADRTTTHTSGNSSSDTSL